MFEMRAHLGTVGEQLPVRRRPTFRISSVENVSVSLVTNFELLKWL